MDHAGVASPYRGQALSMEESAALAWGWASAEDRFYEVVGAWVGAVQFAPVKIYFDTCSQHHAWRAQLWRERLPSRLAHAGVQRPAPPGRGSYPQASKRETSVADEAFAALAALSADHERLAVYCRAVLGRVMAGYGFWRRRCSPASDRPVARVLDLALYDTARDWREGNELLAGLLESPASTEAVDQAASACAAVERLLVGGGWVRDG